MKHFREVLTGIDPGPLLDQIADHPELRSIDTEWTRKKPGTAIYTTENTVLRYLTLGRDAAAGGRLYLYEDDRDREHWDRPAYAILSEARPIVQRLLAAVGDHLGHVIITYLPPGGRIERHIDRWPAFAGPRYWHRFQIPLAVHPRCLFRCGDETLWMQPGSAYSFAPIEHSVENDSDEERISMIVDLHPFSKGGGRAFS